MKDYYKILGVPKNANADQIKVAYRALSKKYHPDLNPDNEEAAEKFKDVNEANQTLSDPTKRSLYDSDLALSREQAASPRPSPSSGGAPRPSGASGGGATPPPPPPGYAYAVKTSAPPMSSKKKAAIAGVSVGLVLIILAVVLVVVFVGGGGGSETPTYTITLTGVGSQQVMANAENLIFTPATKSGSTFVGWSLKADGSDLVTDSNGKLLYSWTFGAATLYPVFEVTTYTLSFDMTTGGAVAQGSNSVSSIQLAYGDVIPSGAAANAVVATREGYTFGGWKLSNGNTFVNMPDSNTTVSPIWTAIQYTVTIHRYATGSFDYPANGTYTKTYTRNYDSTLATSSDSNDPLYAADNSHYTFLGWAISEANARAGVVAYGAADTLTVTSNTELYQCYQGVAVKVTLDYNCNGVVQNFPVDFDNEVMVRYGVNLYDALADYIAYEDTLDADFSDFYVKKLNVISSAGYSLYSSGAGDKGYSAGAYCFVRDISHVVIDDTDASINIRLVFGSVS